MIILRQALSVADTWLQLKKLCKWEWHHSRCLPGLLSTRVFRAQNTGRSCTCQQLTGIHERHVSPLCCPLRCKAVRVLLHWRSTRPSGASFAQKNDCVLEPAQRYNAKVHKREGASSILAAAAFFFKHFWALQSPHTVGFPFRGYPGPAKHLLYPLRP
jgi:hypothetical protein